MSSTNVESHEPSLCFHGLRARQCVVDLANLWRFCSQRRNPVSGVDRRRKARSYPGHRQHRRPTAVDRRCALWIGGTIPALRRRSLYSAAYQRTTSSPSQSVKSASNDEPVLPRRSSLSAREASEEVEGAPAHLL